MRQCKNSRQCITPADDDAPFGYCKNCRRRHREWIIRAPFEIVEYARKLLVRQATMDHVLEEKNSTPTQKGAVTHGTHTRI